mmetsp:Transcript_17895/g.49625  ORF Transcript_17895/g.49625 Transcript_17895/m.49625 type:complete len:463 (+) Transcript_17895:359-1747(+)
MCCRRSTPAGWPRPTGHSAAPAATFHPKGRTTFCFFLCGSQRRDAFVQISPTRRILTIEKSWSQRHVVVHFQFFRHRAVVVRRGQFAVLVSWLSFVDGMVPADAVDVPREGGIEATEEDATTRCHELVDHAVVVRVHILEKVHEIIEEDDVVMLLHGIEEGLIAFVRGDEDCHARRQLVLRVLVQFVARNARRLILEIAAAHMERIEDAIGIAALFGSLPHGVDEAGAGALDLVSVPDMIAHEALHPQILAPILEEEEGVEMHEHAQSLFVVALEVEGLLVLQELVVNAQRLASREILLQSLLRWSIHRDGVSDVLLHGVPHVVVILLHHLVHELLQHLRVLVITRFGKSGKALSWIPSGRHRNVSQVASQDVVVRLIDAIPVRAVARREQDVPGVLALQLAFHGEPREILLHRDDVQPGVFICQFLDGKEIGETKVILLAALAFSQQVPASIEQVQHDIVD